MLEAITMGFDETTMAYDLQRAHSADVWFLRARFFFWGICSTVFGFMLGHALPAVGVNLYGMVWEGLSNFWHHLI